ncbi:MAG: ABC transporter substrate-binding protein, partial [Verrucomicrobiota bacterium]
KKGGTQRDYLSDFPRTVRTFGPNSTSSGFRQYLVDDTGMAWATRHPNVGGFYPGLAEKWAVDMDNNRVFVKINPKATWSDGHPVTSEDALFTFYIRTSDYSEAPFGKNHFNNVYKNVTIYDDHTFSVTLNEKKPDLDYHVLSFSPQPRHAYYEFGPDFIQRFNWRPVPVTGPYEIAPDGIKKGKSITLVRNDNWWAKDNKFFRNRFNPDEIVIKVIRDPQKMNESFKAGDLEMSSLNLTKSWYQEVPDDHPDVVNGYINKYIFWNQIPRSNFGLWINRSKPVLDNVHVRRGIQYASNFDLVIEKFHRGDWDRLTSTSVGFGDMSFPQPVREFSPEKAMEEFAKAGYDQFGPDGILMNAQGQRLSFTVTTGYKTLADGLTILKQEAIKAGLELNLEVLEWTTSSKKTSEKKHEIAFKGLSPFPSEIYPRYHSHWHSSMAFNEDGSIKQNTNNFTQTAIDELDPLIMKYRQSLDHDEKQELAQQMEKILYDDASWVPGAIPFKFRWGSWRWVKWPEDLNLKKAMNHASTWVHWIDEAEREETLQAMKDGKTFPKVIREETKYKP